MAALGILLLLSAWLVGIPEDFEDQRMIGLAGLACLILGGYLMFGPKRTV
jgi:hypothetical protein